MMGKQIVLKIKMIVTLVALINVPVVFAQPQTLWTKTFGGNNWDYGYSVQQTGDRGFIITGSTYSFGAGKSDVWLIKTDSNGNEMWSQTFGGSDTETGRSVQKTTDGGYIITGFTKSLGAGDEDIWLIKADANGNETWSQTFGRSNRDIGQSVRQTADGGYIIVGYTSSEGLGNTDAWLIKTNSSGSLLWERTYGGSEFDVAESVLQTADSGYIIAGSTESYGSGNQDVWLIKTDSNGNLVWSRTFGGSNSDGGHCSQQTTDDGYIITGFTWSFGTGNADLWLIKTDSSGNEVWNKTFGGSDHDDGSSVQQTADGGFIMTGWTKSFGSGNLDVWLVKTDADGNKVWSQTFGGGNIDMGYSVQQTADYGYIISGFTNSHSGGSNDDLWLIRIAPEANAVERDSDGLPCRFLLEQNYPNPFNSTTTVIYQLPKEMMVSVSIYNITGQVVETLVNKYENAGYHSVIWNASAVGSGVYFYKIMAGEYSVVKKCLVLK